MLKNLAYKWIVRPAARLIIAVILASVGGWVACAAMIKAGVSESKAGYYSAVAVLVLLSLWGLTRVMRLSTLAILICVAVFTGVCGLAWAVCVLPLVLAALLIRGMEKAENGILE